MCLAAASSLCRCGLLEQSSLDLSLSAHFQRISRGRCCTCAWRQHRPYAGAVFLNNPLLICHSLPVSKASLEAVGVHVLGGSIIPMQVFHLYTLTRHLCLRFAYLSSLWTRTYILNLSFISCPQAATSHNQVFLNNPLLICHSLSISKASLETVAVHGVDYSKSRAMLMWSVQGCSHASCPKLGGLADVQC